MYKLYINGRLVMKDSLQNVANKVLFFSTLKIESESFEIKEMKIEKE